MIRYRMIRTIFKREILDVLRDKKTVFMTMLIPLLIYPAIMFLMMMVMSSSSASMMEKEMNIAFSEKPSTQLLEKIEDIECENGKLNVVEVSDYKEAIEEEKISAYIEVSTKNGKQNYNIHIDSGIADNKTANKRIEQVLTLYKDDLIRMNISDLGGNEDEVLEPITYEVTDMIEKEEVVGTLVASILPMLLMMGMILGASYAATDIMAGEKERGTLETLFTLPITNLELVIGKYIAVAIIAIANTLISIISAIMSLGIMMVYVGDALMGESGMFNIDMSKMIVPAIITIISVIIFAMIVSALCMCVCSVAKSYKDAQNAVTPVMMIVMIGSMVSSMVPTMVLDSTTASIPVVNIVLLIKSVLTLNYDISLMTIVLLVNTIFMVIAIWALSKLFNSEEILFGSAKGFSFLESRANIQIGTMPSISDGILMYCICLLGMLFISPYAMMKLGVNGMVVHQVLFLVLPLALSIYVKSDLKIVYSIKIPKMKHILGSLFMWIGLLITMMLVSSIIIAFSPQQEQTLVNLETMLNIPDNILLNLVLVALVPAVCEEFLFRGFIFGALRGKSYKDRNNSKRVRNAILISSIMFGIMHMDFTRIITTSIFGIGIAYVVYKTGSIFTGILIHFINNSVVVSSMHYPESIFIKGIKYITIDNINNVEIVRLITVIGIAITSIIIGCILIKNNNNKDII